MIIISTYHAYGSDSAGITVLGNLDKVVVEDWIDLVTELDDSGSSPLILEKI